MLGAENGLRRTTANSAGGWFVTRCNFIKKVRLSMLSSARNLAGKSQARFRNTLNLFKKPARFESSPGHQFSLFAAVVLS